MTCSARSYRLGIQRIVRTGPDPSSWDAQLAAARVGVCGMARQREVIPLGWGDTEVPLHSYVAFYHTNDESVGRSLGFLRTGLAEPGTFCMFLAERARIPGFLSQLQEGYDGDVGACVESGKLVAAPWHPNFEGLADALMGRIDQALSGGEYVRVRAMGLVAWAAVGWGDAAWLKRCES